MSELCIDCAYTTLEKQWTNAILKDHVECFTYLISKLESTKESNKKCIEYVIGQQFEKLKPRMKKKIIRYFPTLKIVCDYFIKQELFDELSWSLDEITNVIDQFHRYLDCLHSATLKLPSNNLLQWFLQRSIIYQKYNYFYCQAYINNYSNIPLLHWLKNNNFKFSRRVIDELFDEHLTWWNNYRGDFRHLHLLFCPELYVTRTDLDLAVEKYTTAAGKHGDYESLKFFLSKGYKPSGVQTMICLEKLRIAEDKFKRQLTFYNIPTDLVLIISSYY